MRAQHIRFHMWDQEMWRARLSNQGADLAGHAGSQQAAAGREVDAHLRAQHGVADRQRGHLQRLRVRVPAGALRLVRRRPPRCAVLAIWRRRDACRQRQHLTREPTGQSAGALGLVRCRFPCRAVLAIWRPRDACRQTLHLTGQRICQSANAEPFKSTR